MFQLVKSAGYLPNFSEIDDDEAREMLTSFMELARMIRDGDPESLDQRATDLYGKLDRGE